MIAFELLFFLVRCLSGLMCGGVGGFFIGREIAEAISVSPIVACPVVILLLISGLIMYGLWVIDNTFRSLASESAEV